jgi:hypothetical protein
MPLWTAARIAAFDGQKDAEKTFPLLDEKIIRSMGKGLRDNRAFL